MDETRALSLPVILGTVRKGRMSVHAAKFVTAQLSERAGVETELIDIAELPIVTDDAGEGVAGPAFTEKMVRADGLVIVTPEYNHSFSGLLKHVLDSCLQEYIHKPVGIVGVSAGVFGGSRVIQSCLPVMRELGLVTIFWDLYFGNVAKTFDQTGRLLDRAYIDRASGFIDELVGMANTLRYGREHIPLE